MRVQYSPIPDFISKIKGTCCESISSEDMAVPLLANLPERFAWAKYIDMEVNNAVWPSTEMYELSLEANAVEVDSDSFSLFFKSRFFLKHVFSAWLVLPLFIVGTFRRVSFLLLVLFIYMSSSPCCSCSLWQPWQNWHDLELCENLEENFLLGDKLCP